MDTENSKDVAAFKCRALRAVNRFVAARENAEKYGHWVRKSAYIDVWPCSAYLRFLERAYSYEHTDPNQSGGAAIPLLPNDQATVVVSRIDEDTFVANTLTLANLLIPPSHQGAGYGTAFIQACMAVAGAHQSLLFIENVLNPKFARFFETLGFKKQELGGCNLAPCYILGSVPEFIAQARPGPSRPVQDSPAS